MAYVDSGQGDYPRTIEFSEDQLLGAVPPAHVAGWMNTMAYGVSRPGTGNVAYDDGQYTISNKPNHDYNHVQAAYASRQRCVKIALQRCAQILKIVLQRCVTKIALQRCVKIFLKIALQRCVKIALQRRIKMLKILPLQRCMGAYDSVVSLC